MFALPAICDNCNTVFSSGIGGDPGATFISISNKAGPCPVCGSLGTIPNGTYAIINDIEATLSVDNGKDVFKLQRILNTTSKQDTIPTIQNKIKKETPQYEKIIDAIEYFFTKTKNTFAAIGIVSTIIFSIIGVMQSDDNTSESVIIENQQKVIEEQRNIIEDYREQNKILKDEKDEKDKKDKVLKNENNKEEKR